LFHFAKPQPQSFAAVQWVSPTSAGESTIGRI
jgi:hypothetical protein